MTTNQGMVPVPDAIISLVPGAQFIAKNDEVEWLDPVIPKPSDAAITAERVRLYQQYASNQYQRNRALAYPPMADYLDAVYWQSQGDETKMTAYLAAVEAVKEQFPRP